MNKNTIKFVFITTLVTIALLVAQCTLGNSKEEIFRLLNSNQPTDLIIGAFEAGESRDSVFLPLLLKNADDPRSCTHVKFKGFSVYQEKMGAMKKILNVAPPIAFTDKSDSAVIKFYIHAVSTRKL